MGMKNNSVAQKGYHQPWGSNTAGRGLDFTLPSHKINTMQSRIRVYESGRTDQGYDPDLPPELVAAQGIPVDASNLVKQETAQGDSGKVQAHVRPSLPPGRPIPVETGSGERMPSFDTRAPRMRDLDAIIEIQTKMGGSDENKHGVIGPMNIQGGLRGGNGQTRRALSIQ